jgi:long-chain acyl-CoA synthetase
VVGMGIPQPLALITLNEIGTKKTKEEIDQMLTAALEQINRTLEHHEKLEKAVVMKESWTVENGLLTPTMKVKRNEIEKIHQGFYPDWFHQKERVVWEKH